MSRTSLSEIYEYAAKSTGKASATGKDQKTFVEFPPDTAIRHEGVVIGTFNDLKSGKWANNQRCDCPFGGNHSDDSGRGYDYGHISNKTRDGDYAIFCTSCNDKIGFCSVVIPELEALAASPNDQNYQNCLKKFSKMTGTITRNNFAKEICSITGITKKQMESDLSDIVQPIDVEAEEETEENVFLIDPSTEGLGDIAEAGGYIEEIENAYSFGGVPVGIFRGKTYPLNQVELTAHMNGAVQFHDGDKPLKGAPHWLKQGLYDLFARHAKPLRGIVRHPIIVDGKLVTKHGYGHEVYFDHKMDNLKLFGDVDDAVAFLWDEYLADFPLVSDNDAAGAIAHLLTVIMRSQLDVAPGFFIGAHEVSNGKTTLAQMPAVVITGTKYISITGIPSSKEETEKSVTATLLKAPPIVIYDNLPESTKFNNKALIPLFTGSVWSTRILGKSNQVDLPITAVYTFTGNNIQIVGDSVSRILPFYMNSGLERSTTKRYSRPDVLGWTLEHREQILSAALTVLSVVGDEVEVPSRFSQWDKIVRAPMIAAGFADPIVSMDVKHDEDHMMQTEVLAQLHGIFGDEEFTANDVKSAFDNAFTNKNFAEAVEDIDYSGKLARDSKVSSTSRTFSDFLLKPLIGKTRGGKVLRKTETKTQNKAHYKIYTNLKDVN